MRATLRATDYQHLKAMLAPGAFVSEAQALELVPYPPQALAWIEAALPLLDSFDSMLVMEGYGKHPDRAKIQAMIDGFAGAEVAS